MTHDAPMTTVGRRPRSRRPIFRTEAERHALMAEYERWDGTQVDFCEANGVAARTLMGWFRKRDPSAAAISSKPAAKANASKPATAATAGRPGGFVEIAAATGPGWDVELSLGDGVTLRLRRS